MIKMDFENLLYEGKAKSVYQGESENEGVVVVVGGGFFSVTSDLVSSYEYSANLLIVALFVVAILAI